MTLLASDRFHQLGCYFCSMSIHTTMAIDNLPPFFLTSDSDCALVVRTAMQVC